MYAVAARRPARLFWQQVPCQRSPQVTPGWKADLANHRPVLISGTCSASRFQPQHSTRSTERCPLAASTSRRESTPTASAISDSRARLSTGCAFCGSRGSRLAMSSCGWRQSSARRPADRSYYRLAPVLDADRARLLAVCERLQRVGHLAVAGPRLALPHCSARADCTPHR